MAATFVVEDGTGLANANALATVAFVDQWNEDHEAATEWSGLNPDTAKEAIIRKATAWIVWQHRSLWRQYRRSETQALPWPRDEIYDDAEAVSIAKDTVPLCVQEAVAYACIRLAQTFTLLADVTRESAAESYSYSVPDGKTESFTWKGGGLQEDEIVMTAVDRMLAPVLHSGPPVYRG
jgi:hypothetical protein